jgi:hypothetical protein
MLYLSKLTGESEFYAERRLERKWNAENNFEENKKIAETELQIPDDIKEKLKTLYDTDPTLLYELAT